MRTSFYFIILLAVSSLLILSCNRKKVDNLEAERARLQADSVSKDSILNDWFNTFNDIEDNLAEITGRQRYITNAATAESPSNPDVRDRIRTEIATINDIMIQNEELLEQLKNQLKSANLKIKALEETIAILTKRVEEKDVEIAGLKDELARLNIEKENLNKTVAQLKEESLKQQEALAQKEQSIDQFNEVWYIVGTKKYLLDNEIIEKSGMLGSSRKLSDKAGTGLFTKADLRDLTIIEINSEKAGLLTIHAEGSYELQKEGKVITALRINDPQEFWKASKFCVVETK
jgi:chromosome segregation ATPase